MVHFVSQDSFVRAKKWIREVQRQANPNLIIFLVANKADLEEQRKVGNEEGEEYAKENGMSFFETSAKTAQNVNEYLFLLKYKKKLWICFFYWNIDHLKTKWPMVLYIIV
uniref:Ras-related protein RHN1-like n=1 Tax=Cicer arietinum TaxID=3827 RepID=A0A3Q7X0B8_CICAR|nr:ras-related protein RHN1-like [Cicer arietinum]